MISITCEIMPDKVCRFLAGFPTRSAGFWRVDRHDLPVSGGSTGSGRDHRCDYATIKASHVPMMAGEDDATGSAGFWRVTRMKVRCERQGLPDSGGLSREATAANATGSAGFWRVIRIWVRGERRGLPDSGGCFWASEAGSDPARPRDRRAGHRGSRWRVRLGEGRRRAHTIRGIA